MTHPSTSRNIIWAIKQLLSMHCFGKNIPPIQAETFFPHKTSLTSKPPTHPLTSPPSPSSCHYIAKQKNKRQ